MINVPSAPIQRLIHDVSGDLSVVAASDYGYREAALEACLLAKEKLQAIREEVCVRRCDTKGNNHTQQGLDLSSDSHSRTPSNHYGTM
jgi:hypothetical protein